MAVTLQTLGCAEILQIPPLPCPKRFTENRLVLVPVVKKKHIVALITTLLVGGFNPSEKSWSSSVGMMTFPINMESHKIKPCSSHHQPG